MVPREAEIESLVVDVERVIEKVRRLELSTAFYLLKMTLLEVRVAAYGDSEIEPAQVW
jgi:hypothetical protein